MFLLPINSYCTVLNQMYCIQLNLLRTFCTLSYSLNICFCVFYFIQGLLAARSILSTNYGSIFIHIGGPVSLHDYCEQSGVSRIPHSVVPRWVELVGGAEWYGTCVQTM